MIQTSIRPKVIRTFEVHETRRDVPVFARLSQVQAGRYIVERIRYQINAFQLLRPPSGGPWFNLPF